MGKEISLHNQTFSLYLDEQKIRERIIELARNINEDYQGKSPIILCILNGSFIFTADLVRHLDFPLTIEFVRYSSYEGTSTTGRITKIMGLKSDIEGKDVLIVEDIIDTGLTLSNAIKDLLKSNPASLKVASLLLKPSALIHDIHCNYIGFRIPDKFVIGYGLDYDELGRDLPEIYQLKDQA